MKTALVIVDVQNDFLEGGSLAVPDGNAVIPVINALISNYPLAVATQDWHPPNHGSFDVNHPAYDTFDVIELNGLPQILWPVHCVQNTHGAELAQTLDLGGIHAVFQKGVDPDVDSYSGFFDNGKRHDTGLADWLRDHKVTGVDVVGLAFDYCVKYTALDAAALGFRSRVILSATRAVAVDPTEPDASLEQLVTAGVQLLNE